MTNCFLVPIFPIEYMLCSLKTEHTSYSRMQQSSFEQTFGAKFLFQSSEFSFVEESLEEKQKLTRKPHTDNVLEPQRCISLCVFKNL